MTLTWDEVVTVEVYDGITGQWFSDGKDYASREQAHAEYDYSDICLDGPRYRVVTTHYRSDDLR